MNDLSLLAFIGAAAKLVLFSVGLYLAAIFVIILPELRRRK